MCTGFDRRFHIVTTIFGLRRIVEVGLVYLLPGNFLAGITGDLSHYGNHRTADHIVAVDGLAGANGLEEYVMFSLIRVASTLPAPVCLAPYPASQNRGLAFAAKHDTGRIVVASVRSTAKGVDTYTVGEFVND